MHLPSVKKSLRVHALPLGINIGSLVIAAFILFVHHRGWALKSDGSADLGYYVWLFMMVGGFGGTGVAMLWMNWSSFRYYYEKALVADQGVRVQGRVTKKYVEEDQWPDDLETRTPGVLEHIYWVEYVYPMMTPQGMRELEGKHDVTKSKYDSVVVGGPLTVRALPNRPEVSYPSFPRRKRT